jgi:LacI family transcriptional regulator
MTNKNIRIKDIAAMADVSIGTVDRVIHNRGRVSPKVEKKVKSILRKTGYTANPIGQSLGTKKDYQIAVIIPRPQQDEYWELSNKGIHEAREKWKSYHLNININEFDLYDADSFVKVSKQVLDSDPDAILAAPVFYDESLVFFQQLKAENIPYILFNMRIKKYDPLGFVGQDLYKSGRVAAELMSLALQKPSRVAVMHTHVNFGNSMHLKNKEKGFRDYLSEKRPDFDVFSFPFLDDRESFVIQIGSCLVNNDLNGIFVTTSSGAYMAAKALIDHNKSSACLIGYDLLEQNIHHLKSGTINFLINQDSRMQAYRGVHYLAEYLLFNRSPSHTNFLPLDIITAENYEFFLRNVDVDL